MIDPRIVSKVFDDFMGMVEAGAVAEKELIVDISKTYVSDEIVEQVADAAWDLYKDFK